MTGMHMRTKEDMTTNYEHEDVAADSNASQGGGGLAERNNSRDADFDLPLELCPSGCRWR